MNEYAVTSLALKAKHARRVEDLNAEHAHQMAILKAYNLRETAILDTQRLEIERELESIEF